MRAKPRDRPLAALAREYVSGVDCEEGGWEQVRSVKCSREGRISQRCSHSRDLGCYLE